MSLKRKIAPAAAALAVAVGGTAIPAVAASSSTHWSSTKCKSYVKTFKKKHKHPSAKQIKAANKILKKHGCTNKA